MSLWKLLTAAYDSSGNSAKVRIDSSTSSLQTVDYAHHEIHSGSMYRVQAFDDAIASSGTLVIAFKVKDGGKFPHFIFEWETEGKATITLYEGVGTDASTGTDVVVKNSRRDAANSSIIQGYATGSWVDGYITKNPTFDTGGTGPNAVPTDSGTIISLKKAYSSSKAGGSSGSRRSEIVLNDNTEYAIVLINNEATAQGGQLRLEWYEHTDNN